MFKLLLFCLLVAFAAANPAPQPGPQPAPAPAAKPGLYATYGYVAPALTYNAAYSPVYSSYSSWPYYRSSYIL